MNISKVRRIYQKAHRLADRDMAQVTKVCRSGCDACCHQPITVFMQEGSLLEYHIKKRFTNKQVNQIRCRASTWISRFNAHTPELPQDQAMLQIDYQKALIILAEERLPCPFLQDHKCMVYPDRPLACRTHTVSDNPDQCSVDPLRDPSSEAKRVKEKHIELTVQLSPILYLRPLAYSIADCLGISDSLKQITIEYRDLRVTRSTEQLG